jgi:hypothetical protein
MKGLKATDWESVRGPGPSIQALPRTPSTACYRHRW